MKILICTQIVDQRDSNLGFFQEWITEFAKHCEKVTVICLQAGEYDLPSNVLVLSLGKERGISRFGRIIRFLKYIRAYKDDYDAVFVHMNPEYILLGGFLWRRWHKRMSLWYAHRSVTWRLKQAVRSADDIFSVSANSFPVATPKLHVMGHGIDTELFKPAMHEFNVDTRIVTTGRIAESKHLIEMIRVLDVLHTRGEIFNFTIVGEAATAAEKKYEELLRTEIEKRPFKNKIHLVGGVPHAKLPALLNNQDIFFNFGTTGNMDKAGLEALALGLPVLTTNSWFKALLQPFGLYCEDQTPEGIADVFHSFMKRSDHSAISATLRNKVLESHSLEHLIPAMLQILL